MDRREEDDDDDDISESVTISAIISIIATGIIYVEFWNASVPALPGGPILALGVLGGIVAGATFYYTGTRSTPLEDVPPLAVFLVLGVTVYLLFPDGLPVIAEFGIIIAVWTDTAFRAAAKFA